MREDTKYLTNVKQKNRSREVPGTTKVTTGQIVFGFSKEKVETSRYDNDVQYRILREPWTETNVNTFYH
jgi:hypothetical protein